MDWAKDSPGWPNAEYSRFVQCRPHHWHLQEAGRGACVLLLHGAGGATQTWRSVFPLLAAHAHVVAVDLPGQGFSKMGTRFRCGLDFVAQDLAALCQDQGFDPRLIVGHSAGGALALALTRHLAPQGIVTLNAALDSFKGIAGWLFPVMAKLMALNPAVPRMVARNMTQRRVVELLRSTGSIPDAQSIALYHRLASDRQHIDGTLAMMAQWSVTPLARELPQITQPVRLIAGSNDRTVPAQVSQTAAAQLPNGSFLAIDGHGHLFHESTPEPVVEEILRLL